MLLCATSERDYNQQHWIEMLALPKHNTIRPIPGLPHRVHRYHDICWNIGRLSIEKTFQTKTFDMNIIASLHQIYATLFSTPGR